MTEDTLTELDERLFDAASDGGIELLDRLLGSGANPLARKEEGGLQALHVAIIGNHPKCVDILLNRGVPIESPLGSLVTYTPLMLAIIHGSPDCFNLLIERGADVNARNNSHCPVISIAVRNHRSDLLSVLIDKGADIDAMDFSGLTPVHYAIKEDDLACLKILFEAGAIIRKGNTPLIMAVKLRRRPEMIRFLADRVDLEARNKDGKTAIDVAYEHGHSEIAAEIERIKLRKNCGHVELEETSGLCL